MQSSAPCAPQAYCTLPAIMQQSVRQAVRTLGHAFRERAAGDKFELEIRFAQRVPLQRLHAFLSCLSVSPQLLAGEPVRSTICYAQHTDLRCVSYGRGAAWEQKTQLAFARLPVRQAQLCGKLVVSRERPCACPHDWELYDCVRQRARYSERWREWRVDVTLLNDREAAIEYEWVQSAVPQAHEVLLATQRVVAEWLAAWPAVCGFDATVQFGPSLPLLRCGLSDDIWDQYQVLNLLRNAHTILPPPVSLTRARLADAAAAGCVASAKADGVRCSLVLLPHAALSLPRAALSLCRTQELYEIPAPTAANALLQRITVLDAELIFHQRKLLVFDVSVLNGASQARVPFSERASVAQALVAHLDLEWPATLAWKPVLPAAQVLKLRGAQDADGVILHEYDGQRTWKWKATHTVDLMSDGNGRLSSGALTLPLAPGAPAPPPGLYECALAADGETVTPLKPRYDKPRPNPRSVVEEIQQAACDAVTLEEVQDAFRARGQTASAGTH